MSFFSTDGVRLNVSSASFVDVPTPISRGSEGLAQGLINRSELEALAATISNAYQSADNAILDIINGLQPSVPIEVIQALINQALTSVFRLRGEAAGDAASPAEATGHTAWQSGDTYRIISGGSSAFGFPTSIGDMVWYDGEVWRKIDNDSTNPSVTAPANSPVVVTPLGDSNYQVDLRPEFLQRIASLETALANAVALIDQHEQAIASQGARLDSAESSLSTLRETVNTISLLLPPINQAITAHAARLQSLEASDASQSTSIAGLSAQALAQQAAIDALTVQKVDLPGVTAAVTAALQSFWAANFPKFPLSAFSKTEATEIIDGRPSLVTTFLGDSGIGHRHFTMAITEGDLPHLQGIAYMGATGIGGNFIVKFVRAVTPTSSGAVPSNLEVSFTAHAWRDGGQPAPTQPANSTSVIPAVISLTNSTPFVISANGLVDPISGLPLADEFIMLKLRTLDGVDAWSTPVSSQSAAITYSAQASSFAGLLPLEYKVSLEYTSGVLIKEFPQTLTLTA